MCSPGHALSQSSCLMGAAVDPATAPPWECVLFLLGRCQSMSSQRDVSKMLTAQWLVTLQAAKTAAEATETAAREADEAANKSDALEATSKAAVAAWRASQVCTPQHFFTDVSVLNSYVTQQRCERGTCATPPIGHRWRRASPAPAVVLFLDRVVACG